MTQVIAHNINSILSYRERISTFLIVAILGLAGMYVFFLHNAITNVVQRENLVKESHVLSTKVSELEAKYFTVKNSIDIELAHAKGFKDAEVDSFISSKSLTAMANHNEL